MRIADGDRSPAAYTTFVFCIRCNAARLLAEVVCDLDGPAFHAYFCARPDLGHDCRPKDNAEAENVYQAQGWGQELGWRRASRP